ncbi:MAG: M14 family zinc carboxypeptidase [Egibacteraceae bacterium]
MRRSLSPLIVLAALFAVLSTSVAGAQTAPPEPTSSAAEQPLKAEQLNRSLRTLERRAAADVALDIDAVGQTRRGRNILLAKFGDPSKTPVLIISSQHGNEPTGFRAAYELIGRFAAGGEDVEEVLDELYVLVMPLVNPDGYAFDTRGNTDFTAPPRNSSDCFTDDGDVDPALTNLGRGVFSTQYNDTEEYSYDINRYHWADWSQSWQIRCNPGLDGRHYNPDLNPVREARTVRRMYDRYQPIWVIDVHNQGLLRVPDDADPIANTPGADVFGSVLWPTNEDVSEEVVAFSKQLALIMKVASMRQPNAELTRYNGGNFAGIARNAYGLLGSERVDDESAPVGGSVLFEISGQSQHPLAPQERSRRVDVAEDLLWAALEATASGSVQNVNPALADLLILPQQERIPSGNGAAAAGPMKLDMTVRD